MDNKDFDSFLAHAESAIISYGKNCVDKFIDEFLSEIYKYSSLSSDDVIDIIFEVYSKIYIKE